MKYLIELFGINFKKRLLFVYLFLFVLFTINYFSLQINIDYYPITRISLYKSLGTFYSIKDLQLTGLLFFLYQIILSVYTFISFDEYRKRNSPEFSILRENKKYYIKREYLIILFWTFFFRTLYFFINFFLFSKYVNIHILDYIMCIIYYIIPITIVFFIYYILLKENNEKNSCNKG